MRIEGARAVVTGANRGLGKALVEAFLERGAACVYAAGRNRDALKEAFGDQKRVIPVALDVTSDRSAVAASRICRDATVLVNNAGALTHSKLMEADALDNARLEMETNYWGVLHMCRAFAPVLAGNGGGAIVNILSMGALANMPFVGSYCASKAATWSLTQGIRAELADKGTLVMGVIAGPIQTDMAREHEREGRYPGSMIANATLDGIEARRTTLYPDPRSAQVGADFARDHFAVEASFAKFL
ncbi:SDR family oxidoreductase [Emcibacter sp. SYSU 3D8]|uniref:SDR family oxidoreductase n=1 Tax=Emcibacter sp. SYSU 3D8 TaxID=3133969 RepID=UPI0031FEC861